MATGGRGELFAVIRQSLQRTLPKPQNSVKIPATQSHGKVKPADLQGTGKPDHLLQDTVNSANLLQDTVKPAKLLQDTVKPATLLQDTVKPANLLQDTVKPANLRQDTVKPAKPPQDTGKPAQLPQFTVKAANTAKLPQDTVVKPAIKKRKKKKKKMMKHDKKTSPNDLSTVQRLPVWEEKATQRAYVPQKELSESAGKSSLAPTQNFIEMLPTEVLVKILSYLDVCSLDYISQVSKMFYQLASDDAIWQQLYMSEFGERRCWKPKATDNMDMVEVQDQPVGYWKRLYSTMAGNEVRRWKADLKDITPYTGLPSRTQYVLRKTLHLQCNVIFIFPKSSMSWSHGTLCRNLCISWELTVCDRQGKQGTFHDAEAHFSESSVIVCWSEGHWPRFHQLSTLQIHGVTRRGPKKPGLQSLMAKFDIESLTRAPKVLGKDRLVKLVLLEPGFSVGIWRGQHNAIAFVMASFHFHKLVERSLLGTPLRPYSVPVVKPPYDDIDPEYGLHGYRLHICLHNTATQIMSGHFSHLFSREAAKNGFIRFTVINKRNLAQHTILSGNITLPWKCAVLEGAVENCCLLSLTLLDEFQKPFWCASTPTAMDTTVKSPSYDYDGDHFRIEHRDPEGRVQMELVWMEEHKQYFLVYLAVFLSVRKVNEQFGRAYRSDPPLREIV